MKRLFFGGIWVVCYLLSSIATYATVEPVEARFTGQSNLADWLIESIDQAERSIKIMVFIFEYEPISYALIRAAARGVNVEVIMDVRSSQTRGRPSGGSSISYQLVDGGVQCYIYDDEPFIMHHKVVFIDDAIFLGSYNFQVKATFNNCENLMKSDSSLLRSEYMDEYDRVKLLSHAYFPASAVESRSLMSLLAPLWMTLRWPLAIILLTSVLTNGILILIIIRTRAEMKRDD